MGIRNSDRGNCCSTRRTTHYPSWGSETVTSFRRHYGLPEKTSLPLMGIRNLCVTPQSHEQILDPHYPSWGSETWVGTIRATKERKLTTPHGDQKLGSWASPPACTEAYSLPLMGIRNHEIGPGNSGAARLTTPHGDQKLYVLRAVLAVRDNSLPLMGIRNPDKRSPRWARDPAHYPSWGSETATTSASSSSISDSHYPSWGSETAVGHVEHADLNRLTTPHGDQKRFGLQDGLVSVDDSLPLMGIRNWLDPENFGNVFRFGSLPLMGIRNYT